MRMDRQSGLEREGHTVSQHNSIQPIAAATIDTGQDVVLDTHRWTERKATD